MNIFSSNEDKAVELIDKINLRVKQIRELMRNSPNDRLTYVTAPTAKVLFREIENYWREYKSIVSSMNFMQSTLFMGRRVDCWNGEYLGVFGWQEYFSDIHRALTIELSKF